MKLKSPCSLVPLLPTLLVTTSAASYTFEQYTSHHKKEYPNESEWQRRKAIFEDNIEQILRHNSDDSKTYKMGVNQFTDMLEDEIYKGLISSRKYGSSEKHYLSVSELPFTIDEISELPDEVDWRNQGVVSPVRDQGGCGSCWAFSSIATLESHIAIQTGLLFSFSPQELVSCAPNPDHCGGSGGCQGSTTEVAYDFIIEHGGVVEEDEMGYSSYHGKDGKCDIRVKNELEDEKHHTLDVKGGVANIESYSVLPANDYKTMMNAVAKHGPVAVAVAADGWSRYESGILRYDDVHGDGKFLIDHGVVLVGYGTDTETGLDYWLVRNSWSPTWGEEGYIRLERVDPDTLEDPKERCGMDTDTEAGTACIDENGDVDPEEMEVCGTSGILSEGVIPVGGYLMGKDVFVGDWLEVA